MNLHVPVDLLGLPIAAQQTAQDPHAAHPGQLLRHTGIGCTLSLTWETESGGQVSFNACRRSQTNRNCCTTLVNKYLNTPPWLFIQLSEFEPLNLVKVYSINLSIFSTISGGLLSSKKADETVRTHRLPCVFPCGVPVCSCGSVPGSGP